MYETLLYFLFYFTCMRSDTERKFHSFKFSNGYKSTMD